MDKHAIASVGQLVRHKLFDYRGVVVDVDPEFMQSQEWYETVARSRPPKDEPWYRVLVHNSNQQTYVAQRNLELDHSDEPVNHPQLGRVLRPLHRRQVRFLPARQLSRVAAGAATAASRRAGNCRHAIQHPARNR